MTAVGIHAHPTRKLGRRSPKNAPAIRFAEMLKAAPAHPIVDAAPVLTWPMDKNDQAGDCVVAGHDHALQAICSLLGVPRNNWTDSELLAYYQTQNPTFRSWSDAGSDADAGMDIQTFLEYLTKKGVILGFAKIDPKSPDELQAATYLGLAIVTGETLQVAQQTAVVWDYVPRSADWGGHCTVNVGYGSGRNEGVSWGQLVPMTDAFFAHQVEEAWFVVTQAHVDHPGFRAGFDMPKFAAAYTAMTGRPFPVAVGPAPAPSPGAAPFPGAADVVATRMAAAAGRAKLSLADYQNKHWKSYFGITH